MKIFALILPLLFLSACMHRTVVAYSSHDPVLIKRPDKEAAKKVVSDIKSRLQDYIEDKQNYPYEVDLIKNIQKEIDDLDYDSPHLDRDVNDIKKDYFDLFLEDQYVALVYNKEIIL